MYVCHLLTKGLVRSSMKAFQVLRTTLSQLSEFAFSSCFSLKPWAGQKVSEGYINKEKSNFKSSQEKKNYFCRNLNF
jgi:hypothetical protein